MQRDRAHAFAGARCDTARRMVIASYKKNGGTNRILHTERNIVRIG